MIIKSERKSIDRRIITLREATAHGVIARTAEAPNPLAFSAKN